MKTYRNEQFGFEIDIPDEWSFDTRDQPTPAPGKDHVLIFRCRPNEAFKFQIHTLLQEPAIHQSEDELRRYTQEMGHTSLGLGRFTVAGKEHVWARYYEGYGHWSKKYLLILNHIKYALDAACLEQKLLLEMEPVWDKVVSSFRLLTPIYEAAQPAMELNREKVEIAFWQRITSGRIAPGGTALQKLDGLKTYVNEKHGFEMDIPEAWTPAPELPPGMEEALGGKIPPGIIKDCFQYCCNDEAINFEIAPLRPEPLLEDTVIEFKVYAQARGFMDLHLGRITVAGKEHVCAHYFINDFMGPRWNKKYMLVFGGIEYALTCTCNDPQYFAKREKDWDAIIQTFHVLKPVDESANATPQADRDRQKRREYVKRRTEMLEDPWKMYALACETMALQQYPEAQYLLDEYLRSKPDHLQAHKDLAGIMEKMGDKTGAIQQLKEVERLDPTDSSNRSNLARLVAESGSMNESIPKTVPLIHTGRANDDLGNARPGSKSIREAGDETRRNYTLALSVFSYLFIEIVSIVYINTRGISFGKLLFLTSAAHQPLSTAEFNLLGVFMLFGIGAFICLGTLLGIAINEERPENTSTIFGFIQRTMRGPNDEHKTLGGAFFSDFTKKPGGVLEALFLQVRNIFHAVFKIFTMYFNIILAPIPINILLGILLFGPLIVKRPMPVLGQAGTLLLWFYACYRAELFWLAKKEGVATLEDSVKSQQAATSPTLDVLIQSANTKGVTPELITKILEEETILSAIRNDLSRTDLLGCKEAWRLGVITPEQDMFDLRLNDLSRQDRRKKFLANANTRFNYNNQIPLIRTAVLFNRGLFNSQFNRILVINGQIKQFYNRYSSYPLRTVLNKGEYIRIRNIQIDTDRPFARDRSPSLTRFLREDGFPLKETYLEGDPLSTERGGVIVIHEGKILVTHPNYFVQLRLIDQEGNLVDIGIDEDFSQRGLCGVKMQPAVLNSLVQYASIHKYTPVVRYHSVPYTTDLLLPLLDVPVSMSGWADLYINAPGRAKLFIAKEKTYAEWAEMLNRLQQLFFTELAKSNYHLLGLTQDRNHLMDYLRMKQAIMGDYYIIQDFQLF